MKVWVKGMDPWLSGIALLASCLGIIFVWNAAYHEMASSGQIVPYNVLKLSAMVGVMWFAHLGLSRLGPKGWQKWAWIFGILTTGLLVAVMALGHTANNAQRWVELGGIRIQPSEFAKVGAILLMASGIAKFAALRDSKSAHANLNRISAWLTPLIFVGAMSGLVVMQPDMDTAAVLALIGLAALLIGGVSWKVVLGFTTVGLTALLFVAFSSGYRAERLANHGNRQDAVMRQDETFQIAQSEAALARGGMTGVGFTQGMAKQRIPEAHNDFIMTTVGEELGYAGFLIVFAVVSALVARLISLSTRAGTVFGRLVLTGLAVWIATQAGANIMMANGTLPPMGIPMPFYSDGGTSMIALWLGIGAAQASVRGDVKTREKASEEEADATGRNRRRYGRTHLSRA